ncbi:MAG: cyanophycin synthetase [Gammaproteobacteria bacterium]|nr:cyanophycin synthetase [Rhodocyclaceae bacterium]MBU3908530.1 cyanophycin synthetase [Gammaproteobacteria bacterium]MBU3988241.1 cyanophycin synthetase [Gammaproteobacteria bacterium]MBU4004558.1 cyanophycin synthetase [Gammaproteobacteria bacterium]MBU4021161.1 cyanophycin synthetase [Gammaproteobacteria bacterium]
MKSIEFLKIVHLRGPNMWTYRPVIEAWVDIGELEESPSNTLPGFNQRLTTWLPTLQTHRCSYGEPGGFVRRLEEGTWPAHILEHVTLELQNLAGLSGGFGRARSMTQTGHYKVVVRAWHEEVTRTALYAARNLVMAAIEDRPFDVAGTIKQLHEMADRLMLGPSTACIVDAAGDKSRRIPHIRLNDGNLVQLGYGSKSRRIWTAETDRTSAIAESVASDKDLTKSLLAPCGVPVPEGRMVDSPADAWEAAQEIGLPVVVKPDNANHGRGVSLELMSQAEVEAAFPIADAEGGGVMVERFVRGEEHRLLIVNNKLVAATRGESIFITGDGKATVRALIDSQLNTDPRRGAAEEFPLETIVLENEPLILQLLKRQKMDGDAVPAVGQQILIQQNGNCAIDVTDLVHPDVVRTACLAARIVGLDIAGIDLVAEDISRPLAEQGGAIVEVNAGPGLLMHLKPAQGQPRPVGEAIADHLFPSGDNGRIPVIGITGSRDTTAVAQIVARLLQLDGRRTGLACAAGLFLGNRKVQAGDCTQWEAGQRLLINRTVDAVVIENPSHVMVSEGLAYDRCQVGVITAIDNAALLPEHGIDSAELLFKVFRTQIDVVLPGGVAVLNADDPTVASMAELSDGEVILFGSDAALPIIIEHRSKGGRALVVRDGRILLAVGPQEAPLIDLAAVPLLNESASHLAGILGAIGAGWALGLPPEILRTGIETYHFPGHSFGDSAATN